MKHRLNIHKELDEKVCTPVQPEDKVLWRHQKGAPAEAATDVGGVRGGCGK